MKEKILKLKAEGKSYKQICEILGCSKGTVAYHCGDGQKKKAQNRQRERRKSTSIIRKVENFVSRKAGDSELGSNRSRTKRTSEELCKDKTHDFQRLRKSGKFVNGKVSKTFTYHDVLEKYKNNACCYLTGKQIDLKQPRTYNLDHIIPISRGGNNTLYNLGLACREANMAKSNLTVDELLSLCKKILEYHGYTVRKNQWNRKPIGDGTRLETGRG